MFISYLSSGKTSFSATLVIDSGLVYTIGLVFDFSSHGDQMSLMHLPLSFLDDAEMTSRILATIPERPSLM